MPKKIAKTKPVIDPVTLNKALAYIEQQWHKLERFNPHDDDTLVGLPKAYLVPSNALSGGFTFNEQYYWDSYFMALGVLGTPRQKLAFNMLDNLVAMRRRFGMIPNGSRMYFTSRSQPPILTSLIMELYPYIKNKKWLERMMTEAKYEYRDVWLSTTHPHWRQVFHGLSRYYDINVLHELAEAESGWDMTSRFERRCLDFIPVDLNSLLYKYEQDFQTAATILGEETEAAMWARRAERRRQTINKYLWNEQKGFYFDFDYRHHRQGKIWSLAGYYPLWAGLASPSQAERLVRNLRKFERAGGLTTTAEESQVASEVPEQWTYPNGWSPLHHLVIKGLQRYGYHAEAREIATKWLATNLTQFRKQGAFLEKYNVVEPDKPPKEGVYPSQLGFGWTNAIFYQLAHEFILEPKAVTSVRKLALLAHDPGRAWHRLKARVAG